jgi:hypothetical protein
MIPALTRRDAAPLGKKSPVGCPLATVHKREQLSSAKCLRQMQDPERPLVGRRRILMPPEQGIRRRAWRC